MQLPSEGGKKRVRAALCGGKVQEKLPEARPSAPHAGFLSLLLFYQPPPPPPSKFLKTAALNGKAIPDGNWGPSYRCRSPSRCPQALWPTALAFQLDLSGRLPLASAALHTAPVYSRHSNANSGQQRDNEEDKLTTGALVGATSAPAHHRDGGLAVALRVPVALRGDLSVRSGSAPGATPAQSWQFRPRLVPRCGVHVPGTHVSTRFGGLRSLLTMLSSRLGGLCTTSSPRSLLTASCTRSAASTCFSPTLQSLEANGSTAGPALADLRCAKLEPGGPSPHSSGNPHEFQTKLQSSAWVCASLPLFNEAGGVPARIVAVQRANRPPDSDHTPAHPSGIASGTTPSSCSAKLALAQRHILRVLLPPYALTSAASTVGGEPICIVVGGSTSASLLSVVRKEADTTRQFFARKCHIAS
ncbi:hypothetical protein MIND_00187200 [Mycena indigotica]|uniref:Uncharacterized protein n=1 Tax=Mycena indigotica TaxID=2126181 RepID=A0A8H6T7I0_9AGAR|nr:uncharacterized protein MIND_00187200 [Mycena indigotica]KAF7311767.1 hypothetical protein MIND_00187200 [Mycena indigotica]